MKDLNKGQRGLGHVVAILVAIAVLGAIGFAGYTVMNKGGEKAAETVANKAIKQAAKAECAKLKDDDLCKFYTNYKLSKQYRMTSTGPKQGDKTVIAINGDDSHTQSKGESMDYEYMVIGGKDTYMKSGDTWYKYTSKEEVAKPDADLNLEEPVTEDTPEKPGEDDKMIYKKVGREACGQMQCFKYEVVYGEETAEKQFIWFDDKDYQLRRASSVTSDGTTDTTFEYTGVSIKAPASFKVLEPNQYVDPTTGKVTTLPDMSQYTQQ